jgi:hypothetical protein
MHFLKSNGKNAIIVMIIEDLNLWYLSVRPHCKEEIAAGWEKKFQILPRIRILRI